MHAFLTRTSELALQQADAADRRLAAQRAGRDESPLPPLLGLPLAVKDVLAVEGIRCTCGSKILENFIPPYTATSVERLLAAGVVIVGKTNTDEFAMGSSTENSAYGPTPQPLEPGTRSGWVERRIGSRGSQPHGAGGGGLRYGGVGAPAGFVLRRHRAQADLRARIPLRAGGLRLIAGCGGGFWAHAQKTWPCYLD